MKIAAELNHPFFYINEWNPSSLFPEDNHFYLTGSSAIRSDNLEIYLNRLVREWRKLEGDLKEAVRNRDKQSVKPLMVSGFGIFLKYLFWVNKEHVHLHSLFKKVISFKIKPVNLEERIQFIMENPLLPQSFVQLSELFIELQKKHATYKVMAKRKSD